MSMRKNVALDQDPVCHPSVPLHRALLLWVLFLLICFGLGYPILNRYDPAKVGGTSDAADYCKAVQSPIKIVSYRSLVPMLAKPFYWMARGRVSTWNPVLFGMLMATSILSAANAVVILVIGLRCGFNYAASLVGALLFLLNFAVPNWNLAAYIDSGEALFLSLVAWSLLSNRWFLLTLWAVPGSLAKETFAPFAFVFALVWFCAERPVRFGRLLWIAALGALGCLTVVLVLRPMGGALHFTADMSGYSAIGFLHSLLLNLTAREFWYTFIWLLPLGLLGLNRMDRRWIWATAAAFVLALLFGAYNDATGNTARAFFNIAGPMLSLSAASFLTRPKSHPA
jgi:hypothetical protein